MTDIIQLLSDNIANQIAAGEVIQRPASAVKELLENAVDAGATEIKLIINDAGKSLIQVIDNGRGMSETDARMCFERHATSKIKNIDDLFRIRTMGFRGEALASIAAVAQVELKTKREEDETGTYIEIENSTVVVQEPVAWNRGTSIAMKNLFFNVPARRNFLKTNASEMRHIVDEFIRVALAFPEVLFSLTANNQQVFYLEKGSLKQRIVQILGNNYNARLVTVQEQTDYMNIYGFVGKPETAKKTRGDQYFFVNNRFIRSPYLSHAVMSAYQQMISPESFPLYVLFIDLDPSQVDINVHPTKQEIKFEDERIIYAFIQSAVKHSLAQYSITPTLEFDLDPGIQRLEAITQPFTPDRQAQATSSDLYKNFTQKHQAHSIDPANKPLYSPGQTGYFANRQVDPADSPGDSANRSELKHWNQGEPAEKKFVSLIDQLKSEEKPFSETASLSSLIPNRVELRVLEQVLPYQVMQSYIVCCTTRGFILINQQTAHERVLYDRYAASSNGSSIASQRSLFPVTIQLSAQDNVLLQELIPDLNQLGYLIEPFGKDTYVIQGTPADLEQGNEKIAIENVLEQFKHFSSDIRFSKREKLIRMLASQHSIKPGKFLTHQEMSVLISQLFNTVQPNVNASGQPTYIEFKKEYLEQLFKRI
ncbi:MAG: DNA mismatch repair endonuclease MutL [Chitinophagaceae bacterium]|nr:MAG: DNA mismatch repair endonuclease MutL [Chitinophagaceae bacterium]